MAMGNGPWEDQWLFLVPLKGGRWHIIPQLAVYTTYIPLIYCLLHGGLYATYHLSGEPETTIEKKDGFFPGGCPFLCWCTEGYGLVGW